METGGGKSIVCCFSHAGENYGVGYIEEGNTEVVAKMIAEATGADLFMIEPVEDYPQGYDECCDVALEEQNSGARPEVKGVPDGWDAYDTVYLGYPIWWGDMPQCLYTFVEQLEWAGKDVHPFNTHAGSGAANVPATLRGLCAGATVGEALAISGTTAQSSRDEARAQVEAWLA